MRRGRGREPPYVKNGIWYLGGRERGGGGRQKGGAFPIGIIGYAAALLLGKVEKPIFKHFFGRGRRKRKYRRG